MSKISSLIPVTALRQDAAAVLKRLRESRDPLVITQRGRAAAVMVSVEAYQRTEAERDILLAIARGERELAAGLSHDLDDVMADADALLATTGR